MKKVLASIITGVAIAATLGISAVRAQTAPGIAVVAEGQGISFRRGSDTLFTLKSVETATFDASSSVLFGFFRFSRKNESSAHLSIIADGTRILLMKDGAKAGEIELSKTSAGTFRATVRYEHDATALRLNFACSANDEFRGFGEQYNYTDFRGRSLRIWTQEQGVGRAKNPSPPRGSYTDSYFPMPYLIDPRQGKGFLIENPEYSEFTLCGKESPDTWTAEVWNGEKVSFLIFPGPRPADVVRQLTAEVGRPQMTPPEWAFSGVWLSAQGGREAVEKRLDTALAAKIPVTAIWSQDWCGRRHFGAGNWGVKYRWLPDDDNYPDLKGMIAGFRQKGVRFLGYVNPYIIEDADFIEPASEKGYLIKTPAGTPYMFQIITFKGSLLDVFNPEAGEWFKSYAKSAAAMGQSGWMADFGEALPFDAVTHAGTGAAVHNLYPTQWHRLNREALEAVYPNGDFVMLTRSGFTGEQKVAQIVWGGDQEADWSAGDGIPTVVTAALSTSLSGIPYFTCDIAGFSGGPSTKQLFMRWVELGAFLPFMRTHDGLQKLKNHRFDTDGETLAHFRAMTRIHAALLPYLMPVARESVTDGLPMVRHTMLVDPEWDAAYSAENQWLIGNDLLVAPVVTENAVSIRVSFPQGEWEHLLTGEKYEGRTIAEVSAPVGTPAVFVRAGKYPDMTAAVRAANRDK